MPRMRWWTCSAEEEEVEESCSKDEDEHVGIKEDVKHRPSRRGFSRAWTINTECRCGRKVHGAAVICIVVVPLLVWIG